MEIYSYFGEVVFKIRFIDLLDRERQFDIQNQFNAKIYKGFMFEISKVIVRMTSIFVSGALDAIYGLKNKFCNSIFKIIVSFIQRRILHLYFFFINN